MYEKFYIFHIFTEVELETLRREKMLLLQRVSELESGAISGQSSASRPREGSSNMSGAGDSESSISGIVHSVHIRTGGETPSVTSLSPPKRTTNRSVSQSDLLSASKTESSEHGGVHIEIKNLSKSQDHLALASNGPSPRLKSSGSRRSSTQGGSVSVINLKQSVDNLPHRASSSGDLAAKGRYMSPNR